MKPEALVHPFPAFYRPDSKVLILGSFPSVKSREQRFFYGHPQNRFWRVLATLFAEPAPASIDEKRAFLMAHRIALWDVIASCTIIGSSDSSIRDVVPNPLETVLSAAPIREIFVNGKTAARYYRQFQLPTLGREAVCLPSTSPANAAYSPERLAAEWIAVRKALEREEP